MGNILVDVILASIAVNIFLGVFIYYKLDQIHDVMKKDGKTDSEKK